MLAAVPFFGSLYEVFVNAVARPSRVTGVKYNQVSSEFFNAVHEVLSRQVAGARQPGRAGEEARSAVARRALVAGKPIGQAGREAAMAASNWRLRPLPTRWRGRASRLTRERTRAAWLFVAPMLLVLAAVAGWPLLRTIWFSFTDANLADLRPPQFVGLDQLRLPADRPATGGARGPQHAGVRRSSRSSIETMLGLGIALALNAHFRGRGLLRAAVLIPWAIPTVVSAQMWSWMFNDVFGIINVILQAPGPDRAADRLDRLARHGLGRGDHRRRLEDHAVHGAAAAGRPADAADRVLRGGPGRRRPPAARVLEGDAAAAQAGAAGGGDLPRARRLRIFDLIYVMTGNNKATMSMSVYARQQLVDFQDVGYGSAAATMLFLIIAVITAVYLIVARVGRED